MTRLKFLARLNAGQSPPSEMVDVYLDGLPFLQGNAEFGALAPSARYECEDPPKRASTGDIRISVRAPVGALNVADREYGIGRGLCAIQGVEVVPDFLWWWLEHSRWYLESVSTGTTFAAVTASDLGSIVLPEWGHTEQRAIADYLDRETAKIDALIGKQERLIETLRERRNASWSALYVRVAAGAKSVPVRRLITSIVDGPFGSSLASKHYVDAGVRVIRLGNIGVNEFKHGDAAFLSDDYAAQLSAHSAEPGDVVIAGLGDERMPLGRAAVVPSEVGTAIVKADCFRVRLKEAVSGAYFAWAMSAPPVRAQMRLMSRGSTRQRLNTSVVRGVALAVPPPERQREVLHQSRLQTAKIDLLISKAERFIELAKERRSALITAAVTGQIDVRGESSTEDQQQHPHEMESG